MKYEVQYILMKCIYILDDYKGKYWLLFDGVVRSLSRAAFAEMSALIKMAPSLGPLIVGIAVSPLGMIPAYIFGGKYEFVFNKVEIEK